MNTLTIQNTIAVLAQTRPNGVLDGLNLFEKLSAALPPDGRYTAEQIALTLAQFGTTPSRGEMAVLDALAEALGGE